MKQELRGEKSNISLDSNENSLANVVVVSGHNPQGKEAI